MSSTTSRPSTRTSTSPRRSWRKSDSRAEGSGRDPADVDDLAALAIELHPVRWAAGSDATELRVDCWEFERGPELFYRREGFQTVKRRCRAASVVERRPRAA